MKSKILKTKRSICLKEIRLFHAAVIKLESNRLQHIVYIWSNHPKKEKDKLLHFKFFPLTYRFHPHSYCHCSMPPQKGSQPLWCQVSLEQIYRELIQYKICKTKTNRNKSYVRSITVIMEMLKQLRGESLI